MESALDLHAIRYNEVQIRNFENKSRLKLLTME